VSNAARHQAQAFQPGALSDLFLILPFLFFGLSLFRNIAEINRKAAIVSGIYPNGKPTLPCLEKPFETSRLLLADRRLVADLKPGSFAHFFAHLDPGLNVERAPEVVRDPDRPPARRQRDSSISLRC
jgi:hypothetical protein